MSYSGKREEVPRFLTASFHVLSLDSIHGRSSLSKHFPVIHDDRLVQFIWTCLVWPQAEVRARVEVRAQVDFVPLDGRGVFLHLLLGALVLSVGLDHPAHDEDVGAARVELAVVGVDLPELVLDFSHVGSGFVGEHELVRGKLVPSLHDDVWRGLVEEAAVHALGGDGVLAMIDVLDLHGAADELGEDTGVVGVRVVAVLRADALGVGVATELVRVNVHVKLLLDLAGADGENVGLGDVEFHLVLVHHYRQVGILRIWFNSGNGLIPETYFSKRSNFERISVEGTTNQI